MSDDKKSVQPMRRPYTRKKKENPELLQDEAASEGIAVSDTLSVYPEQAWNGFYEAVRKSMESMRD